MKLLNYIRIITIIIINMIIKCSELECAAIAENMQPNIRIDDLINTMNEEELIILGEHLQPDREHFFNLMREHQNDETTRSNTGIHWEAIAFFVVGSALLFIISQYGNVIIESLFNLRHIPEIVNDTITNVIQATIQHNGLQPVRNVLINRAHELLNDPHTANHVVNGLTAIRRFRAEQVD